MPEEIYEVVAQGARYWFLFLMALIAWRSYRWYRRDRRQRKKRLRLLPDAGFVGEMVVLEGGAALKPGTALPVPREGTLGLLRTNDLCVPVQGVAKRHLWFCFEDGQGLRIEPMGRNGAEVDGQACEDRRHALCMAHGSRLTVGEAVLRLRLFAGFESVARAPRALAPDAPSPEPEPAPAPPPSDQERQLYQQQLYQQQLYQQQLYQQQLYQQWLWQQQHQQQQAAAFEDESGVFVNAGDLPEVYDHSAFMRPPGETPPQEEPEAPPEEDPEDEPDDWPYAPNPGAEDPWDDDLTDAAAPPRSAYIGHDEAERAKRRVWDRYLGGGRNR